MQVDRQLLECTVFLGVPTERGFAAEGTAFFVRTVLEEMAFSYLVTCAHVVEPFAAKRSDAPNTKPIWIRINRKDNVPAIKKTIRGDWIHHPDRAVDICVYPCDVSAWEAEDTVVIGELLWPSIFFTPDKENHWGKIWLGDQVFITGVFVGRVGERNNIPVVRVASIAALPDEPVYGGSPRKPAYLVETKSLGGTSGSPVFLHTTPVGRHVGHHSFNVNAKGVTEMPYFLIGMVQGGHSGRYPSDFAHAEDKIVPVDADFNAGISIVLPHTQIMEAIDQPKLSEARMKALDAKRKDSGYRPLSSKNPEPDEEKSNLDHKEDFTALLGAAAKKKPQAD